MKKKNLLIGLGVLIAVLLIAAFIWSGKGGSGILGNKVKKGDFEYTGDSLDRYILVKRYEGFDFYFIGMESLKLDGKNIFDFIEENSIEELKNYFNKKEEYKDGGSALYTCDDDSKCDPDIKMVFCNTLSGDKSVYAGAKDTDLDGNYCINNDQEEATED